MQFEFSRFSPSLLPHPGLHPGAHHSLMSPGHVAATAAALSAIGHHGPGVKQEPGMGLNEQNHRYFLLFFCVCVF